MPPKADYWKHFKVVGVVAYCLVAECQQPNISLGALPKPGEKKRLGLGFSTFVCADLARGAVVSKLAKDDPICIWMTLDGWSAVTTSYIGAEICELMNKKH